MFSCKRGAQDGPCESGDFVSGDFESRDFRVTDEYDDVRRGVFKTLTLASFRKVNVCFNE